MLRITFARRGFLLSCSSQRSVFFRLFGFMRVFFQGMRIRVRTQNGTTLGFPHPLFFHAPAAPARDSAAAVAEL